MKSHSARLLLIALTVGVLPASQLAFAGPGGGTPPSGPVAQGIVDPLSDGIDWLGQYLITSAPPVPEYLGYAKTDFDSVRATEPGNVTGRVYAAATTVLGLMTNQTLQTVFANFGLTAGTVWGVEGDFDTGSTQTADQAVDAAYAEGLPAIDAALADLNAIPTNWPGSFAIQSATFSSFLDEDIWIDVGDVAAMKAALNAAAGAIRLARSQQLNVEYPKIADPLLYQPDTPVLPIVVDGNTSDWSGTLPNLIGRTNDDLRAVTTARQDGNVFVLAQFQDVSPIGHVTCQMFLDVDGRTLEIDTEAYTGDSGTGIAYLDGFPISATVVWNGSALEVGVSLDPATPARIAVRSVSYTVEHWKVSRSGALSSPGNLPVAALLASHPECLADVRHPDTREAARTNLLNAIDLALRTETVVGRRTDGLLHLVNIDPVDVEAADQRLTLRTELARARASLIDPTNVVFASPNGGWQVVRPVLLAALFGSEAGPPPPALRGLLPPLTGPLAHPQIVGAFPDPTLGGLLPGTDNAALTRMLEDRAEPQLLEHVSVPQLAALGRSSSTNWIDIGQGLPFHAWDAACNEGHSLAYRFDWGDGQTSSWSNVQTAQHAWPAAGTYDVRAQARCMIHPGVKSVWSEPQTVMVGMQTIHYVNAANPAPVPPYLSWEDAATNIQDAIDAAVEDHALVLVTNGVYSTGGRAVGAGLMTRVVIDRPITVKSTPGPRPVILGAADPGTQGIGANAIRCAFVTNGAVLRGFILQGGYTSEVPEDDTGNEDAMGGGALVLPDGIVERCAIIECQAQFRGGGACGGWGNGGTLYDCDIATNAVRYNGGGAAQCSLYQCRLIGNVAEHSGGGAFACNLLDGCSLNGNVAARENGGGAYQCAELARCTLSGNRAYWSGGGASECLRMRGCSLYGNHATTGGGAASNVEMENCILSGNSANQGGGVSGGNVRNSAILGNTAVLNGGGGFNGQYRNCTLTGNSAATAGGVVYGELYNCIAFANHAGFASNWFNSTFQSSCTSPLPEGDGNIASDPRLAGPYHLSAASPCIGAGDWSFASGTDIDGETWLSPPSMGCDEFHADNVRGPLGVSIQTAYTNVAVGFSLPMSAQIQGYATSSVWDFGDGTQATNTPWVSHAWTAPGSRQVALTAFNADHPGGVSATVTVSVVVQPVHHVDIAGVNPVPPYLSWDTAATNIQDAVDVASVPGALVLATNGVYDTGGCSLPAFWVNRVAITNPVTVRSVNGPAVTTIVGGGTFGDDGTAVRCVYAADGAILAGFTLAGGCSRVSGGDLPDYGGWAGGGAWCTPGAVISNCVITNCYAMFGGGAWGGTLYDCTLANNYAQAEGGGAHYSTLVRCTLTGNAAGDENNTGQGGGAWTCTLSDSAFVGNTAYYGGGAWGCDRVTSCTFSGNTATFGGGTYACDRVAACTFSGNTATYGGGAFGCKAIDDSLFENNAASGDGGGAYAGEGGSTLSGCTLLDNFANSVGGGSANCMLFNCTLRGNGAGAGGGAGYGALIDCTLDDNYAYYYGGGAFNCDVLDGCTISSNTAAFGDGGGTHGCGLNRCLLVGNYAGGNGGGSYGGGSGPSIEGVHPLVSAPSGVIEDCTYIGNSAWYGGGGACGGTLDNCLLFGNASTNYGGGAYSCTMFNCTVARNRSEIQSGGVESCKVYNSIVWSNTALIGPNYLASTRGDMVYTCTTPLPDGGVGNICADPLFLNPAKDGYRLSPGSPCIDAGLNDYVSAPVDLDGKPRILGPRVDMGAYEYFSIPEAVDCTNVVWTTGGGAPWFGQIAVTSDGEDSAQSGPIGNSQTSWVQAAAEGKGTLSFAWRVESEAGRDVLRFMADGQPRGAISGTTTWQTVTLTITNTGSHVFLWDYTKSKLNAGGADAGWLDQVVWTPVTATVTATASPPEAGTVDGAGTFIVGSTHTLAAHPNRGFRFDHWENGSILFTRSVTVPDGGTNCTAYFAFVPIPLPEALDTEGQPELAWTTGGDAPWNGWVLPTAHFDGDAAQSAVIGDNGTSWLATTVTGPGLFTFWWRVSSEENYDYLNLYIDGEYADWLTGESGWRLGVVELGAGEHTLSWEYSKDEWGTGGEDAAWLDEVVWMPYLRGFALWASQHGLPGDPAIVFGQDRDGDRIPNGFEYAFGRYLDGGLSILDIRFVDGHPVADVLKQDPDTTNYVSLVVEACTNLTLGDWVLPVEPETNTSGMPPNRTWYRLQGDPPPDNAFFRLEAQLK